MGLRAAIILGFLAALGVATVAHDLAGGLGDLLRWKMLHWPVAGVHLYFSVPLFVLVTLFGWVFIIWSRE